jgi:hypothetical protein
MKKTMWLFRIHIRLTGGAMRNLKLLSLAVVALSIVNTGYAQPDVVLVRLSQPPPNQLRIADLWKIELNNMSGGQLRVYLHGTAEELSIPDDIIAEATTRTIMLPPGRTFITGNAFSQYG